MTTVEIDLLFPDGTARGRQDVLVSLVHGGAGGSDGTRVIGDTRRVRLDEDGHAEVDLTPNATITPAGTFYRLAVERSSPSVVRHIEVPVSPTAISWADPAIQVEIPTPPSFVQTIVQFPGSIDGGNASTIHTPPGDIDGGGA